MTQLTDILDFGELRMQQVAGNVTLRNHPDFPDLVIANYTDQVAFKREWNDVTRMCRGLIWNDLTGEVLARPFEKFFNWDEKEAPRILDDQVVWHWADKADGSLGIAYVRPDGAWALATRGSFQSEQAKLGTDLLNNLDVVTLLELVDMMDAGYTPLFEICGPSNRIVLRYDEDHLVHLGYVHIATGQFVPAAPQAPRTMRDLLGDLDRGREGWVVWLSNTKPLKVKEASYVELHRMVSNLTEKEVWRQLRAGTYNTYVKELPDELYQLAEGWADGLRDQFSKMFRVASVHHQTIARMAGITGELYSRKSQALWIQQNLKPEYRGLVFGLLDGKDISDSIWKMLEVKG